MWFFKHSKEKVNVRGLLILLSVIIGIYGYMTIF